MSIIAEFSVVSSELALHQSTIDVPSVTVEVTNQVAMDGELPMLFFWATGEQLDEFEAAMADDETVTDIQTYTDLSDRRLYRVQVAETVDTVGFPAWVEVGATRMQTTAKNGTSWNRFRFPDRDAFRSFYDWCLDNDIEISLEAMYTEAEMPFGTDRGSLTDEQAETLRCAYRQGYFEIPRGATLADVASELDISAQAASERLRRAYASLVETTLLKDE